MDMNMNQQGAKMCKCPHHKMVPFIILLLGVTFLLGALNVLSASAVGIIWPILVILGALGKLNKGKCNCCQPK